MSSFKILNTLDLKHCPQVIEILNNIGDLDTLPCLYNDIYNVIGDYDAYLASTSVPVDASLVRKAKKLKVIGSPATGTDHLDLTAISQANIDCFDISKELDLLRGFTATSELAFTLLLGLNRQLCQAVEATRKGDWARERFTGFQLMGKTFGSLGLGRLGTISSRIANGFGMKVIAYDIREDISVDGVERVDLKTLYQESDVLSIHVHLNNSTRGMIDEFVFEEMKQSTIIINTSRGAIINETALLNALKSGNIAGAGLDLIDGEWMDDINMHPLVQYSKKHDNLIITPHIGGCTYESIYGARIFMANKIADYLKSL